MPLSADRVQTYQDSGGWAITVPAGWHVMPFTGSREGITTTGVQLSNVVLPPPRLIPGSPVQVNSRDLPAHGIGLIITADDHAGPANVPVAVLPLQHPQGWWTGSSLPGTPYMRGVRFSVGSTIFAANVKIGPRVDNDQHTALVAAVQSIHPAGTSHS